MAARILDGTATGAAIRAELAPRVAAFQARAGRRPGLGIVLAGHDPGSEIYVRNKLKTAGDAGILAELIRVPADAPVGRDLRQYLLLDERKITIKLTPNRGDCLSVLGVAREAAAITGAPLRAPSFAPVPATIDDRLPVRVLAPDLCGRFSGRVIRGLNARAPTPLWMKQRLERSGQRSISALVDISNYVMLELGRPSHVFDLDKVHGGLQVRWGRAGETVELLNGQTVEVDDWVGVIADDRGVEALAGVMGGEATAVALETTNVYVEAAFWWPESIQGRARRFNFSTDAAHRFERGVDFSTTVEHIEYITRLLLEICGTPTTRVGPIDDQVLALPERRPVTLRTERCRKVLGVAIGDVSGKGVPAALFMAICKTLLKTELLPYQMDGVAFAAGTGRAILADDMGLGKTIQGVGTAELLAREADRDGAEVVEGPRVVRLDLHGASEKPRHLRRVLVGIETVQELRQTVGRLVVVGVHRQFGAAHQLHLPGPARAALPDQRSKWRTSH